METAGNYLALVKRLGSYTLDSWHISYDILK